MTDERTPIEPPDEPDDEDTADEELAADTPLPGHEPRDNPDLDIGPITEPLSDDDGSTPPHEGAPE